MCCSLANTGLHYSSARPTRNSTRLMPPEYPSLALSHAVRAATYRDHGPSRVNPVETRDLKPTTRGKVGDVPSRAGGLVGRRHLDHSEYAIGRAGRP